MKGRMIRTTVHDRDAHQDVIGITLGVLDCYIEVAALIENTRIDHLILWYVTPALLAFLYEVVVGV